MNRLPDNPNTIDATDAAFDAAARACYRQAADAVSPQLRFKLRPQAQGQRTQLVARPRRWALGAALAGTAAVALMALGLGIGLQPPAGNPASNDGLVASIGSSPPATDIPATALDEDPDFFAWLNSTEARQFAME